MNHNECESDEDCEVYFLKPVNEYNIVEKIKEANEELFSTPPPLLTSLTGPQRRVQFRQNLEEFEPGDEDILQALNCKPNLTEVTHYKTSIKKEEFDISLNSCEEYSSTMTELESDLDDICEEIEELVLDSKKSNTLSFEDPNKEKSDLNDSDKISIQNEIVTDSEICEDSPEIIDHTKYDNDYEEDDEDDDDDDMSIIAAIYMPDNIGINGIELDSDTMDTKTGETKKSAKRHFSFRVKKQNSKKKISPPHTNKIKFNYKTCCEYRNSELEKLPRYTGYLSEYGLTQKQWEAREKRMQQCRKVVLEKNLKARESEIKKMSDNERAFTKWLKNKMRFPINQTRNMFDFKKRSKILNMKL